MCTSCVLIEYITAWNFNKPQSLILSSVLPISERLAYYTQLYRSAKILMIRLIKFNILKTKNVNSINESIKPWSKVKDLFVIAEIPFYSRKNKMYLRIMNVI